MRKHVNSQVMRHGFVKSINVEAVAPNRLCLLDDTKPLDPPLNDTDNQEPQGEFVPTPSAQALGP